MRSLRIAESHLVLGEDRKMEVNSLHPPLPHLLQALWEQSQTIRSFEDSSGSALKTSLRGFARLGPSTFWFKTENPLFPKPLTGLTALQPSQVASGIYDL